MNFLADFFRIRVPPGGKSLPLYYRRALMLIAGTLCVYAGLNLMLFAWSVQSWELAPCLLLAVSVGLLFGIRRIHPRVNLLVMTVAVFSWCFWYIQFFGWGCGAQHLLLPLILLCFFNVSERPVTKVVYLLVLVGFRLLLYRYSISHTAFFSLEREESMVLQTVNSVTLFLLMACLCILFSTNVQDAERQLRLDNQELHREAGTDPLTGLPNRRALIEQITRFVKTNPDMPYCVAIADIDHFKKVNDTWGHACGDYTLKELTALFQEKSHGRYHACRWGGEEFCFFIPGVNLDEGGMMMHDLCFAVAHMPLSFEGQDFSITITIGVEEDDFVSPLEALLDSADRKLYMGKEAGRNRVVI